LEKRTNKPTAIMAKKIMLAGIIIGAKSLTWSLSGVWLGSAVGCCVGENEELIVGLGARLGEGVDERVGEDVREGLGEGVGDEASEEFRYIVSVTFIGY
jgi:hypothetical protein